MTPAPRSARCPVVARRLLSLLVGLAVMVCFATMTPGGACAEAGPAKAAPMAGAMAMAHAAAGRDDCAHHHQDKGACHACDICAGVDAPRLFVLRHEEVAAMAETKRPQSLGEIRGVIAPGLDRPPKRNG
jgi:hypothetical protein